MRAGYEFVWSGGDRRRRPGRRGPRHRPFGGRRGSLRHGLGLRLGRAGTSGGCATLAAFPGCNNPNNGTDPSARELPPEDRLLPLAGRRTFGGRDYSACDTEVSGRATHGQIVTSVILGNPARGRVPPPRPQPDRHRSGARTRTASGPARSERVVHRRRRERLLQRERTTPSTGSPRGRGSCSSTAAPAVPSPPRSCRATVGRAMARREDRARRDGHQHLLGQHQHLTNPSTRRVADRHRHGIVNNPIMVWPRPPATAARSGNDGVNASGARRSATTPACKNCLVVGGSMVTVARPGATRLGGASLLRLARQQVAPRADILLAEATDYGCRSEDTGTENQTGARDLPRSRVDCGTSISAPQLAAATALIREYFDQGFYNGKPTKAISAPPGPGAAVRQRDPDLRAARLHFARPLQQHLGLRASSQLPRVLPLVDYPETVVGTDRPRSAAGRPER